MGDSFANGAQTAAYGFLFNYCLSYGCFNELKASLGRFFDSFNPQYTMTAQGAGSVSAHMLVAGASYSERLSVNINGQFCSAQQVCLRLGLGAQLSTGMQGSVSIKSGTNPATSGDITLFAGIGADVAVGISSFGGQGTVGTDSS